MRAVTALVATSALIATGTTSGATRSGTGADPIFSASRFAPKAGRKFVGVAVRLPQPRSTYVFGVSCDASVGGHLQQEGGNVVFVGGRRLQPILRRTFTPPNMSGRRYLAAISCQWQIPRAAAGELLSLVPTVPCNEECTWGLDIKYGFDSKAACCDSMFTQKTWRIRRR
ncbi:MAG TPA: hypothetical protein VF221_00200 [Chloroflexota bacterium]